MLPNLASWGKVTFLSTEFSLWKNKSTVRNHTFPFHIDSKTNNYRYRCSILKSQSLGRRRYIPYRVSVLRKILLNITPWTLREYSPMPGSQALVLEERESAIADNTCWCTINKLQRRTINLKYLCRNRHIADKLIFLKES